MRRNSIIKSFRDHIPDLLKRAGKESLRLRKKLDIRNKANTGHPGSDIVTNADLAIQELILEELLKTKLKYCLLIGEEDTESVKKFSSKSNLLLSIDPIDGTLKYALQPTSKDFQIIIQLKSRFEFLVTAIYFPACKELLWIEGNKLSLNGKKIKHPPSKSRVSSVASKGELTDKAKKFFKENNLKLIKYRSDPLVPGFIRYIKTQYAGFYVNNINAYDGLVWSHITNALGGETLEIRSGEMIGKNFDFFKTKKDRNKIVYHPGEYIALFNGELIRF